MAKPNKPTGFRLTDEARSALEYTCDRKGWQFSVFVSALLENAVDDVSAHEAKVNEILERQKKAKTAAARAAAAGKSQWKTYSETWPAALDGDEDREVTWTHDEIDKISERFATVEYWGDKIDHWLGCTFEADRERLNSSWLAVVSALPLPVRERCIRAILVHCSGLSVAQSILTDKGFFELFCNHPCLPITNKFTGVKLDAIEKMSGSFAEREIGTVTDVFDSEDWHVLDEMSEFYEKHLWIPYHERNELELERFSAGWREMRLGERRSKAPIILAKQCVEWKQKLRQITPKAFVEMFNVVSSDSGKNFDPINGPHPRGRTIYQVAVAMQLAELCGAAVRVTDLYKVIEAKSVKSAITAILRDWSFFFERELTRTGEVKRGGVIKLSGAGSEYFTTHRCFEELGRDYFDPRRIGYVEGALESLNEQEPDEIWEWACSQVLSQQVDGGFGTMQRLVSDSDPDAEDISKFLK